MVKLLCSRKAAGYLILVSLMIDTGSQHNVVFGQAFCSETFLKKAVPHPGSDPGSSPYRQSDTHCLNYQKSGRLLEPHLSPDYLIRELNPT